MASPTPSDEFERLIELSELDLDYSNLQDNLNDLTNLASHIVGTEVSLINLIDSYTQWSVANTGIDLQQMPREDSVCQYTIMENEGLEIKDLSVDERFKDKEYVASGPRLRYYYGVPLKTSSGHHIGALCVLDSKTRELDPEDKELLNMIANQVVRRLEALKEIQNLRNRIDKLNEKQKKVSHDIRNPITGIIGLTEIMEEEIENERINELKELVEMIRKGGNNLMELVDEIMEYDEHEEPEPGENEFNCSKFCTKLKELYMPQAKSKGVELDIQTEDSADNIIFSKARLLQIVGNLLSNSIKFTDDGGSVKVRINAAETDEDSEQNNLHIKVSDTGVGMTEEKVKEITEGNAESQGGTEGEKGYGFGLALVQHLIQKADGSMKINSEVGEGTEFRVMLPV